MATSKDAWTTEQIASLNAAANAPGYGTRDDWRDVGGIFQVTVIVDGNERVNRHFKTAGAALRAYINECARYSVIATLRPKQTGSIRLNVRHDSHKSSTWNNNTARWS